MTLSLDGASSVYSNGIFYLAVINSMSEKRLKKGGDAAIRLPLVRLHNF